MAKKIKIVKRDGTVSSIELGTKDSMSGGGTHKTVKIENSVEGYAALEGSAPLSKLIITKGVNILRPREKFTSSTPTPPPISKPNNKIYFNNRIILEEMCDEYKVPRQYSHGTNNVLKPYTLPVNGFAENCPLNTLCNTTVYGQEISYTYGKVKEAGKNGILIPDRLLGGTKILWNVNHFRISFMKDPNDDGANNRYLNWKPVFIFGIDYYNITDPNQKVAKLREEYLRLVTRSNTLNIWVSIALGNRTETYDDDVFDHRDSSNKFTNKIDFPISQITTIHNWSFVDYDSNHALFLLGFACKKSIYNLYREFGVSYKNLIDSILMIQTGYGALSSTDVKNNIIGNPQWYWVDTRVDIKVVKKT